MFGGRSHSERSSLYVGFEKLLWHKKTALVLLTFGRFLLFLSCLAAHPVRTQPRMVIHRGAFLFNCRLDSRADQK